jgi:septal ring factor EnvC (AmiA/AmiB activator)
MALPSQQNPAPNSPSGSGAAGQQESVAAMIIQRLNEVNTRMRLAEERIDQTKERLRVFDDQMLSIKQELNNDISKISGQIEDLRKSIKNVDDTIHHIIKELELTAKKQELTVLEKYVEMMDPTRYVTKDEFKRGMK